jgi:hypothetical protein
MSLPDPVIPPMVHEVGALVKLMYWPVAEAVTVADVPAKAGTAGTSVRTSARSTTKIILFILFSLLQLPFTG